MEFVPSLRAWYGAAIADFLEAPSESVLGRLASNGSFALLPAQRDAWKVQIAFLRECLRGLEGSLYFEFNIPRMGRRVDAVVVVGPVLFVLEFKVGESSFDRAAVEQVWDYALDLKNFHEASHAVAIVPILISTDAVTKFPGGPLIRDEDDVYRPVCVGSNGLRPAMEKAMKVVTGTLIDSGEWYRAPYRPTPTILEAARTLYANHSVEAIARFDAGAMNLRVTSLRIDQLVDEAMRERRKIICFVTGVPGAGKTLVGLNVATRHRRELEEPTHAVFLSGNGPLVSVLCEALTRDEVARRKAQDEKGVRKGKVSETIKAFIQNVHHFRDDALVQAGPPFEHVVIFDEAQRAWNLRQTANFMQRKKNQPGFSQSEPEFLISYMDRHEDWAVIICLVGGGQEINTGEAGIDAWLDAVLQKFPDWHMYISSRLVDSEYSAGEALNKVKQRDGAHLDDCLHLAVSMRSFRAENVSTFIKSVLDCDVPSACEAFTKLSARYPIAITRELDLAKRWVRSHARGTERYGMVASSKAQRLKPQAIDVRVEVDPIHWFLNGKDDTRSSYFLEDAATEFQVQGLELDWTCVSWDADFRFAGSGWSYHDFRGDQWTNIKNTDNRNFLRNAYRVLLTRARQGMVIFVPEGDAMDVTRTPAYYDTTFDYLAKLGIPVLK